MNSQNYIGSSFFIINLGKLFLIIYRIRSGFECNYKRQKASYSQPTKKSIVI